MTFSHFIHTIVKEVPQECMRCVMQSLYGEMRTAEIKQEFIAEFIIHGMLSATFMESVSIPAKNQWRNGKCLAVRHLSQFAELIYINWYGVCR